MFTIRKPFRESIAHAAALTVLNRCTFPVAHRDGLSSGNQRDRMPVRMRRKMFQVMRTIDKFSLYLMRGGRRSHVNAFVAPCARVEKIDVAAAGVNNAFSISRWKTHIVLHMVRM